MKVRPGRRVRRAAARVERRPGRSPIRFITAATSASARRRSTRSATCSRRRRFGRGCQPARRAAVRRRPLPRRHLRAVAVYRHRAGPIPRASQLDFYKLSAVHNAPGDQASHCLREETDIGAETGDRHALAACRATITTLYWQALATLDPARARWTPTSARCSRIPALPGQDADPRVGLLLLRGARRARAPGQLHPHLPAHGRHRRRTKDHVGLQLVVAGARRSGRGAEWARPRDDPRRLRGRQPEQRRPPALGDRGNDGVAGGADHAGHGRPTAAAAGRRPRGLDDLRAGLLDRERVL